MSRTVKIYKYIKKWKELEDSGNPFALVVMANIKSDEKDNKLRYEWKRKDVVEYVNPLLLRIKKKQVRK